MKKELRKSAKEIRNSIVDNGLSKKIMENLFSTDFYKKSKNIMCYFPIGKEVSTLECFNDLSKKWFLPRICGENMVVCEYSKENCSVNKYGIVEPLSPSVDLRSIDLIILPSICVDKNGFRIGYGKGFYDKFLAKNETNAIKVAVQYSDLCFENVFPEQYDIKCDYIITEKAIYKC